MKKLTAILCALLLACLTVTALADTAVPAARPAANRAFGPITRREIPSATAAITTPYKIISFLNSLRLVTRLPFQPKKYSYETVIKVSFNYT